MSATEMLSTEDPAEGGQQGPRLILKFRSAELPELDRIEFHANSSEKHEFRQLEGDDTGCSFRASKVSKALPIFFLDYLCARLKKPPKYFLMEGGSGTPAAALGNAIADKHGCWGSLFFEFLPTGGKADRREKIFGGKNWGGKPAKHRIIFVKSDYLPPDSIEVFWNGNRLRKPGDIQKLTDRFRKAKKLPPPTEQDFPAEEESLPEKPAEKNTPTPTPPTTSQEPTTANQPKTPKPVDLNLGGIKFEFKTPSKEEPKESPKPAAEPPPSKIDPKLFEIQNPSGLTWDDNYGLIDFGDDDSGDDIWRIRDASEGLLIFGIPASGKTSASGFLFAKNFLSAGFGGLVMTAKTDEANRWVRLCKRFGRENDCVLINEDSPHKLNLIAYECQRPGKRVGKTKDLVAFFRTLITIMAGQTRNKEPDAYWVNSVDELMETMFEVFLLADEPMTIDRLKRFVTKSPKSSTAQWQGIPYFGEIMKRAQANAKDEKDKEAFQTSLEFWTESFADLIDVTRSGVVSGFTSMASVLLGRGIREMISAETTLTPESILSGKIVILDVAPKGDAGKSGLMIQSAWKYLLQRAIERRADKGKKTARPVFLWEDEGHLFFSPHDEDFQPTARDCRAAHVIITQNLENFKKLGKNLHSVMAVFGSMNTHIFHANSDLDTNKWASERIGTTIQTLMNFSSSSGRRSQRTGDGEENNKEDGQSSSSSSVNQQFARAFKPESFQLLKKPAENYKKCEALLLWCSHSFKSNGGQPYCVKEFEQDPEGKPHN